MSNLFRSLFAYLLILFINCNDNCYDTKFTRIMGGTSGNTEFTAMDVDSNANIVVGGSSFDGGIVSTTYQTRGALALYIHKGNLYLWGVQIYQ